MERTIMKFYPKLFRYIKKMAASLRKLQLIVLVYMISAIMKMATIIIFRMMKDFPLASKQASIQFLISRVIAIISYVRKSQQKAINMFLKLAS